MVIDFSRELHEALQEIRCTGKKHAFNVLFNVQSESNVPGQANYDEIIQDYGKAKWRVIDLLNEEYASRLPFKLDLHNWINFDEGDEVAYFLNEAGSNCLNYSEFKSPRAFHAWLGSKGFIIGIEQDGKGFDARAVNELKIKQNEGAAFVFFRRCRGTVFFDNATEARVVYFMVLLV